METKQTARAAMATHRELVQSFIDRARAAGLSEELIDSLLDMDIAQLQEKVEQLKGQDQSASASDTRE
jgi:hypothetical protein